MKKIFTFVFALFISCVTFAQTVNGDNTGDSYTVLATSANANACFGSAIDVNSIEVKSDGANVYLFFAGKLDQSNSNGIGIFLDFSELTGVSAGTNLTTAGAGHFLGSTFYAGMETDYILALNPGNSANCYIDMVKKVGGSSAGYLGNPGVTGGSATATGQFANSVTFAFNNGGGATQGFEIKIPFNAVGITGSGTVRAFATVVSGSGYFADVTVPGTISGGCSGNGANYNTLGGGPYASAASAVLPITLSRFEVKNQDKTNFLDWTTETESNASHFEVEKSTNGTAWSKMKDVKAFGNSVRRQNYDFTDETPNKGINYYRLKMVDRDGSFDYSKVVSMNFNGGGKVNIFPNPAQDVLSIAVSDDVKEATVEIFNINGQAQMRTVLNGNQLNISELSAGLYFVQINDENGQVISREKLMKK